MGKAIAYLDILGFGNYSSISIQDTVEMLLDYQDILNTKIVDIDINPLESYPSHLRELANQSSINSFEYFLPFSDSIFIQSSRSDDFVKQLSHFVLDCFCYKSSLYSHPENSSDPSIITQPEVYVEDGKVARRSHQHHWFPLLFRGGISYGESYVVDVNALVDSKQVSIKNIAGKALVKAVKTLEPLGKGPRLFCDSEIINEIKPDTKDLYVRSFNGHYELLWPAFHYVKQNPAESEVYKIRELLIPAGQLWKAYKDANYGIQYWELMVLIVNSSIQYFRIYGCQNNCRKEITKCLDSIGLNEISNELLKESITTG